MPKYANEFNEAIHEARRRFLGGEGVPRRQLRRLYDEFAVMLVRIDAEASTGIITAERAEGLKRSIMQEMARFAVRLETILIDGVNDAAEAAALAHTEALARAARAAGVSIRHSFTSVPNRALDNMMARRGLDIISNQGRGGAGRGGLSGTFETLVRRKIRNLQPEIDQVLTSAVARGQSAGRLTSELAISMTRDDPALQLALERIGPRGKSLLRKLHERRLDEITDIPEVRSLLYDARRIAVSEPLSAFHESNALGMFESPVVDVVQWTLSGRHSGLSSAPDQCDAFAEADLYGYGKGRYNKRNPPSLAHPHCGCSLVAVVLEPAEWGKPPRPMPPLRLVNEAEMKALLGDVTPAYARSMSKSMNNKLRAAYTTAQPIQRVAA